MKIQVVAFTGKEKVELVELKEDTPLGADEMRGKTLASLISPGTEIGSQYRGEKFPAYPGYASVFEVEEVGAEVDRFNIGDVVFCTGPNGIGGHRSVQRCPQIAALPVPEGLSPIDACFARLMNVSMSSITTSRAHAPGAVIVTGLGPVGNLAAQMLQANGYRVVAVDPVAARRDIAQECGLADVRDTVPKDDPELKKLVQAGFDCSGHEQAVLDLCFAVQKGGEVVTIGVPWQPKTQILAHELMQAVYRNFLTLRTGWEWQIARHATDFRRGSVFENMSGALRWLAEGRINTKPLHEVRRPGEAAQAFTDLAEHKISSPTIAFDWSA